MTDSAPTDLPALRFADAARRLGVAARAAGLTVPAFRCPPRVDGANRTIRRFPGGAVVSVRLRGRPFDAALADMVDGVLVSNRVPQADVPRLRAALLATEDAPAEGTAGTDGVDGTHGVEEPAARAA